MSTHWGLAVDPGWIQPPAELAYQSGQRDSHLQHGEPFAQACASPAVERNELGPCPTLAVLPLDLLRRGAPPLRPELVGVGAPRGRIAVGRVAVVPDVGALGDEDAVAEDHVGIDPPVDELANGREQAQALVDDRGEVRRPLLLLLGEFVGCGPRRQLAKDGVLRCL
jgi:hypothetical protein